MVTKTLTITDTAYGLLARNKLRDESFSQEIVRVFNKKGSIMDLAGAWSDITETETEKMKASIKKLRKNSEPRQ